MIVDGTMLVNYGTDIASVDWLSYDQDKIYITLADVSFLGTHIVTCGITWRDNKFFSEVFESSFNVIFESLTETIDLVN